MCIAIVTKPNQRLPDEWLANSFNSNPDGGGIAYIQDGQVKIHKGLMEYDKFYEAYDAVQQRAGHNHMLVHCRIATAGPVNQANCHPFRIKEGALIHNGHLWSPDNKEMSDTREFASIFYNILDYDSLSRSIEEFDFADVIGNDRMAMLYDDGRVLRAGHWQEEDVGWFSNGGYKYGLTRWENDAWDYNYCMM